MMNPATPQPTDAMPELVRVRYTIAWNGASVVRETTVARAALRRWRRGELAPEALVDAEGGRVEIAAVWRVPAGDLLYTNDGSGWSDEEAS